MTLFDKEEASDGRLMPMNHARETIVHPMTLDSIQDVLGPL